MARIIWLKEGYDSNRNRRNMIQNLKIDNNWIYDINDITNTYTTYL